MKHLQIQNIAVIAFSCLKIALIYQIILGVFEMQYERSTKTQMHKKKNVFQRA